MAHVENDLSAGVANTRCSAMVSSTTPRLGSHMAAVDRSDGDEFVADFLRELRELFGGQRPHIGWTANAGKQARLRLVGWAEGGASSSRGNPVRKTTGAAGGELTPNPFRGRTESTRAVVLFFELLDLHLGIFQAGFANFQQFVTVLELGEEFGQRHIARFHRIDDLLELGEGFFEGELAGGFGVHAGTMRLPASISIPFARTPRGPDAMLVGAESRAGALRVLRSRLA